MPIEIKSNLSERLGVLLRTEDELYRQLVDLMADSIIRLVRIYTPIKTGRLKASWRRTNRVRAEGGYTVRIYNRQDYAPYVEWDTRPHVINAKPGGWLAFRGKDGRMVFRKSVRHPGTMGAHMLGRAMATTARILPREGEERMRVWAREAGFDA